MSLGLASSMHFQTPKYLLLYVTSTLPYVWTHNIKMLTCINLSVAARGPNVGIAPSPQPGDDELLLRACQEGDYSTINFLLEKGVPVDVQNEDGFSALMGASKNDRFDLVKRLCGKGADVDLQNLAGESALMHASQEGNYAVAKFLIEKGAKVDMQKNNGWSPLMIAIRCGHRKVAELLLEKGAEIDHRDLDGFSALIIASKWCEVMAAKLLIEKGAQVNLQDKYGWSALMHGIHQVVQLDQELTNEAPLEISGLLLDHGADVDMQSTKWESPLSLALQNDSTTALIEKKVSMNNSLQWIVTFQASYYSV